ncbi:hypothetical protein HOLleu_38079 [Holothuria leucospilota]|uniref:Uncharacterized protein n=1 Tax=Holothuria leucospilota TaxID=206669 RepID=A0A9Q0YI89_HOLLE|nr:hypothetical protein HOLleu_38079 [Holothuria leucospilota]
MVNPFTKEDEHLIKIASGVIASYAIQKDLTGAEERGEAEVLKFFSQRLQSNEVDLFEAMEKIKLKTFTNLSTTVKTKIKTKTVSMKADRNLMARLVIGRYRNLDLKELLSFNLGPFPLSLATSNGTLAKTNKSKLLHAIEALSEDHILTSQNMVFL